MENEIDYERKMEWAREIESSVFDDWKWDNINQLRQDFCEEHEEEFNDFCQDEYNNAKD
jgi:hypothetical protein